MYILQIPENHPSFTGHFPGQPILPGVLLLERLVSLAESQLQRPLTHYTVYNVKFLSAVMPNARLKLSLVVSNPEEYKFTAYVLHADEAQETLACSGQLRVSAEIVSEQVCPKNQ